MKPACIALVVLFMLTARVEATPIQYAFSGDGGLTGGFIFDDSVAFVTGTSPDGAFRAGELPSSPLHSLWGSFGGYDFTGTPRLSILTATEPSLEFWIVRASLSADPSGSPLSPIALNLFIFTGVPAISLMPPTASIVDPANFRFNVQAMNSTVTEGRLSTLQIVPVPDASSTWLLLMIGTLSLRVLHRKQI